jgi:hypothetical protein
MFDVLPDSLIRVELGGWPGTCARRPVVAAVTGPTNLYATRTIHDLCDYGSSTLAELEGVLRIETSLTNRYLKHARTIRTSHGVNMVPSRNI